MFKTNYRKISPTLSPVTLCDKCQSPHRTRNSTGAFIQNPNETFTKTKGQKLVRPLKLT